MNINNSSINKYCMNINNSSINKHGMNKQFFY